MPIRQELDGSYEFTFFLHGVRHLTEQSREAILALKVNDPLRALSDFQNPKNDKAILLSNADHVILGYLPNYLNQEVNRLLKTCSPDAINFNVKKVNANAPAGFSLLCSLQACWSDDSAPFSDEEFKPIPAGIDQSCYISDTAAT